MKLNQATAAALLLLSTFTLTAAASSSASAASSHEELKDKIAPLLASKPIHYLHRMLQLSDECIADAIYGDNTAFYDALGACTSRTVVGNTETNDYSACPLSRLTEACTADNRTIVAGFGEINWDCTYKDESVFNIILGESHWCVATSCVSEWESEEGQMSDKIVQALESMMSKVLADAWGYEAGDVECKLDSSSTAGSSVGAGEGSGIPTWSPTIGLAGEATNGDGAGEGSSVGAGSSSAGEPTGAGEGNCIADAVSYVASPAFNDALGACASETVVGTTITYDYSACPLSHLMEACTADNRAIVAGFGEINWDCTFKEDNSVFNIIEGESHWCVATSCVSEWESGQGQMSDEFLKEWEKVWKGVMPHALGYEAGDVECKVDSSSTAGSSVGAGEGSVVGAGSSSAGEATNGDGAAESLAVDSSAGKATGMLAITATAAAAALFFF